MSPGDATTTGVATTSPSAAATTTIRLAQVRAGLAPGRVPGEIGRQPAQLEHLHLDPVATGRERPAGGLRDLVREQPCQARVARAGADHHQGHRAGRSASARRTEDDVAGEFGRFGEQLLGDLEALRARLAQVAAGVLRSHLAPQASADPVAELRSASTSALDALLVDPAGVWAHEALTVTYISASRTHAQLWRQAARSSLAPARRR